MADVLTVYTDCWGCKQPFFCDPDRVPSIRVNAAGQPDPAGERTPLCRSCITRFNVRRAAAGLPPVPVQAGAYPAEGEAR